MFPPPTSDGLAAHRAAACMIRPLPWQGGIPLDLAELEARYMQAPAAQRGAICRQLEAQQEDPQQCSTAVNATTFDADLKGVPTVDSATPAAQRGSDATTASVATAGIPSRETATKLEQVAQATQSSKAAPAAPAPKEQDGVAAAAASTSVMEGRSSSIHDAPQASATR